MTNVQILKKAIEKAEKNGFKLLKPKHAMVVDNFTKEIYCYETIILSHDFARAFFGDEETEDNLIKDMSALSGDIKEAHETYKELKQKQKERGYCWQYHLQQMVLEEEPLKYLERFL